MYSPSTQLQSRESEVPRPFRMFRRDTPPSTCRTPYRGRAARVLRVHARYRRSSPQPAPDCPRARRDGRRLFATWTWNSRWCIGRFLSCALLHTNLCQLSLQKSPDDFAEGDFRQYIPKLIRIASSIWPILKDFQVLQGQLPKHPEARR